MTTAPSVKSLDDQGLIRLVESANKRLVFVAPGVSEQMSKALATAWRRLGSRMSVVLDADPGCCRLGYGSEAGLRSLHEAAAGLGVIVANQPHLRVGVIITEHETLIFTPSPLLIEDGAQAKQGANAISLPGPPPSTLAKDLGIGPRGVSEQVIGLDALTQTKIKALSDDLKKNPPLPFDVSRHMLVFNAALEFVEFSVSKIQLQRIDIPIPPELSGFAGSDLRTLFRFDPGQELTDAKKKLEDKKKEIDREFTRSAPGFGGSLIERSRKKEFLQRVDAFRPDLEAFRAFVRKKFSEVSTRNQKKLFEALLPHIIERPPPDWAVPTGSAAQRKVALGRRLERELQDLFGKHQDELVAAMRIDVLFKGVTFECLNDTRFKDVAGRAFPHLTDLHAEFQAAPESGPSGAGT
jgi:hypothetical protein